MMEMEKLMKWREMTEKMYGKEFWSWIFNEQKNDSSPINQPNQPTFESKKQYPPIDIYMNDHEVTVLIEIPGLTKDDVQLALSGDQLKIKGNMVSPYPKHTLILGERYHGQFEKTIDLPKLVMKEKAAAKYINGMLYVSLPREADLNVQQIKID